MTSALGLNKDNFIKNVISKRISKRRNKIHRTINTLKRKFKERRSKYFSYLTNKDDVDIITLEPIKNISIHDLFIFKKNNLYFGTSASNMLKWIYRFDFETIPTNPYTNLRFDKMERYYCYSVALNYYNKNKNICVDSKLKVRLDSFKFNEKFRCYPNRIIDHYNMLINNYLGDVKYMCGEYDSYIVVCSNCMINYDLYANHNMPDDYIEEIKDIGYRIRSLEYKINEIYSKIDNNYFI